MDDYLDENEREELKRFGGREGVLARIRTLEARLAANRIDTGFIMHEKAGLEKLLVVPQEGQPPSRAAQELRRKMKERRQKTVSKLAGRELDASKLSPEARNKLASAKRKLEATLEDMLYGDN